MPREAAAAAAAAAAAFLLNIYEFLTLRHVRSTLKLTR